MTLGSLINAKVHLISGMLIGVGAMMICKEMSKKKRISSNKDNVNNEGPSE